MLPRRHRSSGVFDSGNWRILNLAVFFFCLFGQSIARSFLNTIGPSHPLALCRCINHAPSYNDCAVGLNSGACAFNDLGMVASG